MALATLVDKTHQEKDRGSATLLLLLDLSMPLISLILVSFWITFQAWECFCSCFKGRPQSVVLGDCCSALWPLAYGVPQDSILSLTASQCLCKASGEGHLETGAELPPMCR